MIVRKSDFPAFKREEVKLTKEEEKEVKRLEGLINKGLKNYEGGTYRIRVEGIDTRKEKVLSEIRRRAEASGWIIALIESFEGEDAEYGTKGKMVYRFLVG